MSRRVPRAFDRLLRGERAEVRQIRIEDLRWVVFSDHHRGQKDGADDFVGCARAYRTALASYLADSYGLVLLGDVEELWECSPNEALEAHGDCLDLEARFARRDRLVRVYGNHDDHWAPRGAFDSALSERLPDAPPIPVREALLLEILGPDRIGSILMTHGHQGTTWSDSLAFVSRFFVRTVWRRWQRRTGQRTSSLSDDFRLRHRHEMAMSQWAEAQEGLLLVTGHTHHPVFGGEAKETYMMRRLGELETELAETEDPFLRSDIEQRIKHFAADLRYREAQMDGHLLRAGESSTAYFNSGCCCYKTGSITGIELADAEIRLVRWHQRGPEPEREVLRRRSLIEVLAAAGAAL